MATKNPKLNSTLQKALALHQSGRISEAIRLYEDMYRLSKTNDHLLYLMGTAYIQTGELDQAVEHLKKSIDLNPQGLVAYNNLGIALRKLGQLDEALRCYKKAIALKPDFIDAHYNSGNVLQELKRFDEALICYNQTISLNPSYVDAHFNKGKVLQDLNCLEEALLSLERAIALKPDYAEAYSKRTIVLDGLKRFDEALASIDKAITLKPDCAVAHSNRGVVLWHLKRYDLAPLSFKKAIMLDPDCLDAQFNQALLLLLTGNYALGWALHECRFRKLKYQVYPVFDNKLAWRGETSLTGKTILVYPEQGLGDTIQFSRYIPMLAEIAAKVVFVVPGPLVEVMRALPCEVVDGGSGKPLTEFDAYCPTMSLPLAFKTTVQTIPASIPYLSTDKAKVEAWAKRLCEKTKLRVGLVWSGGFRSDEPESWEANSRRNIPLEKLAPLNIDGVEYYSLQIGEDAVDQLRKLKASSWGGPELIDHTNELHDFSDTAALIENLDLVIAVDTSTAHIAGAIGKPVWLLNRFDTDWRWFADKEVSPWYPTIRIFRQPAMGDWEPVVDSVTNALKGILSA